MASGAPHRRDPVATRVAFAIAVLKGLALLALAWWALR